MFSCFSHIPLFVNLWTVAHQVPLSTGFSRQESWSGLLCPSPEDLPDPGTEPRSPALQTDSSLTEPPEKPLKVKVNVAQLCPTLWDSMAYSPWNSPGQNTGVGSLSLLQGIFPTQGLNPGLPHCRQILYWLSQKQRPRILQWVAYPFSSRSSQPRNWTGVSCIAGGFFNNWGIRKPREALSSL